MGGCGSDDSDSTSGPASDGSSPTQVAQQFLAAAKAGRGEEACALMTDHAVATTAAYVKQATDAGSSSDACPTYFIAFQTSGGGTLPSLRIGRVTVHGDRGQAQVLCPDCRQRQLRPLGLRSEGGEWRVEFDPRVGY